MKRSEKKLRTEFEHAPISVKFRANSPVCLATDDVHIDAAEKLMIVCFNWESTSSAMVITSIRRRLKSTTFPQRQIWQF